MLEVLVMIVGLVVCFVPVMIAIYRKHNKILYINCLIMVGGFTMSMLADVSVALAVGQMFVLWFLALIWSVNNDVACKFKPFVPPAKRKEKE